MISGAEARRFEPLERVTCTTIKGKHFGIGYVRMRRRVTALASIMGNGREPFTPSGLGRVAPFARHLSMATAQWKVGLVVKGELLERIDIPSFLGVTIQTVLTKSVPVRILMTITTFVVGQTVHLEIVGCSWRGESIRTVVRVFEGLVAVLAADLLVSSFEREYAIVLKSRRFFPLPLIVTFGAVVA